MPSLVILDYRLPGMDDFEVLRSLHENPVTREIPVLMLASIGADEDVFGRWQGGSVRYMPKPFHPMELILLVRLIFAAQDGADGENGGRYTVR